MKKEKDTLEIEKGIPIPRCRRGKWIRIVSKMEVGDSFLLKSKTNKTAAYGIYLTAKLLGMRVSIRQQDDGNIRVWRIK